MSSYHRLLVHRMADSFGLGHVTTGANASAGAGGATSGSGSSASTLTLGMMLGSLGDANSLQAQSARLLAQQTVGGGGSGAANNHSGVKLFKTEHSSMSARHCLFAVC